MAPTPATLEQIPATPVDEHPAIRRAARKLRDFADKLSAAQQEHARLLAEREQLRQERHDAGVLELSAGREPNLEKFDARLLAHETKLAHNGDRVAQLQDVLAQQENITRGIREQVLQELREQIRAEGRAVFTDLLKLLKQVEQQNIKLLILHERASEAGGIAGLPFAIPPGLLRAWLDQAK